MSEITVGSHWIFFIPPGWLIGATVTEVTPTEVVLSDVAWLEAAGDGKTNIGDVPMATTAAAQLKACARSHQLPDGTRMRREALLMCVPAAMSLKALARRNAAEAIKGTK
jgi:hypothetical protein